LRYPDAGYGGFFHQWARSAHSPPYNSWGNGAAMRISPVGFAFNTLEEVLAKAKEHTEITHNHPEGIKGAQAVASAIFLARTGKTRNEIKEHVETTYGYDLSRVWTKSDPPTSSTNHAKGQCRKQSLPS